MKVVDWISDRLEERSTWVGIISILTGAGIAVAPAWQEAIISVGCAVGGAIGIVTKDG